MRTTGFLACTMLLLGTCAVAAEKTSVQVSNAWVRATVPGQPVAGAYMDLRADRAVKLVGVASPVAKRGEIHEMKDDGGMMTMRAVEAVALPAGTTVSLAPGGLHVMLFGLEKPLVAGRKVKLTLEFRGDSGRVFKQTMEVPVRAVD
jgi:periplasmic copper chaperone A